MDALSAIGCAQFKSIKICLASALLLFSTATHSMHSVRLPVVVGSIGAALSDHSIKISLDSSSAPGFDWSNNCADITAVDTAGATLGHFVESCDTVAEVAEIWVKLPSIPASPNTTEFILRYADPTAVSSSDAASTFDTKGFRYHTQPYTGAEPGPESRAEGDTLFNEDEISSNPQYGCTQVSSTNTDNSTEFGANNDIAYHIQSFLEIGVAGNYEFRYGADHGHGGEFTVADNVLEADWSEDIWWSLNYSDPDTYVGSINLDTGVYKIDSLGFERCCDGPGGMQYRLLPTGSWTDMDAASSGLTVYAPDCPMTKYKIKTLEHTTRAELVLSKTVSNEDPRLGSTVTFSIIVTNNGPFAAENAAVVDTIPAGFSGVSNISHAGTLMSGNTVQWVLPTIPAGDFLTVSFDALVN